MMTVGTTARVDDRDSVADKEDLSLVATISIALLAKPVSRTRSTESCVGKVRAVGR